LREVSERKRRKPLFLEEELAQINPSYGIQVKNEDWRSYQSG